MTMANETVITIIGNLTADPELRFTPSGSAVANFTIASTPRTFDKNTNEWKDGDTLFLRSSVWREAAENAAESLTKGMRVIAQGRLKQRSFEKDGQQRTVVELEVDEIGPSLKSASAKVSRSARGAGEGTANRGKSDGSWTPDGGGGIPWGSTQGGDTAGGWGTGSASGGGDDLPF